MATSHRTGIASGGRQCCADAGGTRRAQARSAPRRSRRSGAGQGTSLSPLTLPTYFISHGGGPWPWIKGELNGACDKLEVALKAMPAQIGTTPHAVLVISGHWEERAFTVMSSPNPPMISD
jgi:hypothetical protein